MENMEMLKLFACFMSEEIADAEKYAKQAIKWKDRKSDIAEGFMNLSKQEATHYQSLHDMVVKLIKHAADSDDPLSEDEMAVYEFLNDMHTDKFLKAKEYQEMYKEM